MPTQEIPNYEWVRFFNEVTSRHRGSLVTVEMLGRDIGNQVQVCELPLEGITVEPNEVGEDRITIVAGVGDAHISHTVDAPNQVWLRQDNEGRDEALQIEWFGGNVLVRIGSAALPETADNLLAREAKA